MDNKNFLNNGLDALNQFLSEPKTLLAMKDEVTSLGKSLLNQQLEKTDVVSKEALLNQQALLNAALVKLDKLTEEVKKLQAQIQQKGGNHDENQ